MSFPSKEDRQVCWGNRDLYWKCLDEKKSEDSCAEFRKQYEKFCPSQWVSTFNTIKLALNQKEYIFILFVFLILGETL